MRYSSERPLYSPRSATKLGRGNQSMRSRSASNFNEDLALNRRQQAKRHGLCGCPMLPPSDSLDALHTSDLCELETVYWTPSALLDEVRLAERSGSCAPMLSSTPKRCTSLLGDDEPLFFSVEECRPVQEQFETSHFLPTAGIYHLPTIPAFPSAGNLEAHTTVYGESSFPFLDEDILLSVQEPSVGAIIGHPVTTREPHPYSTRKLDPEWPDVRLFTDGLGHPNSSIRLHQEDFISTILESNLTIDHSASTVQPFPSSASIVDSFIEDETNRQPKDPTVILDESFNDSGLDFPLVESPEFWGPRRDDKILKPGKLRLTRIGETVDKPPPPQLRNGALLDKNLLEPTPVSPEWTFDEEIVVSLLQAGVSKEPRESARCMKRRQRRMRIFGSVSEKITEVAKRCRTVAFGRW